MKGRPKAGSVDLVGPGLTQLILAPKSHQERKSKGENDRARRKKGGGEKKKAMVALLVFIMATMMAPFGLKNKNCHVDKIIRLAQALGLAASSIY